MLSSYGEAEGDYDEPLQRLLRQPHAEAAPTFGHLHARLLWCQVDADDLHQFRDRVLVPLVTEALGRRRSRTPQLIEDLVGLIALVPEPPATDAKAQDAWKKMLAALPHAGEHAQKTLATRNGSLGARAREPAADDQEGELLQRRGGRVPDVGHRGAVTSTGGRTLLDMNRYQWTVLFAAWLGWGFDVFDGLLFNYVAPNCVPTLLGLPIGSPAAKAATLHWGGILTSILLLGWAAGGILFGQIADRIGRTRTLMLTMLLYALGTAACAAAPTSGCWSSSASSPAWASAASGPRARRWSPRSSRRSGASRRARCCTRRRPSGLFLATFVNFQIAGVLLHGSPETSWRFVFLFGLVPAAVAFVVRLFVRSPSAGSRPPPARAPPAHRELFTPEHRARDAERLRDGGDRAHHLVGRATPSSRSSRRGLAQATANADGPGPGRDAGAGRGLEGARDQRASTWAA